MIVKISSQCALILGHVVETEMPIINITSNLKRAVGLGYRQACLPTRVEDRLLPTSSIRINCESSLNSSHCVSPKKTRPIRHPTVP